MDLQKTIGQLRKNGHKVTPQRTVIIQTVLESSEMLTPAALYEKVKKADPGIGEVTVYRTLNMLQSMGMVCVIQTEDNTHSYIGCPPVHHDHLVCSGCGKVINFTHCNLGLLEKRLAAETGFSIADHRLDFYGRCGECGVRTQKSSACGRQKSKENIKEPK